MRPISIWPCAPATSIRSSFPAALLMSASPRRSTRCVDHDYNIIIVRDACSNSHDDSMAAFMNTIFPRMARVRTTDQVLEMVRGAKST